MKIENGEDVKAFVHAVKREIEALGYYAAVLDGGRDCAVVEVEGSLERQGFEPGCFLDDEDGNPGDVARDMVENATKHRTRDDTCRCFACAKEDRELEREYWK